MFSAKFSSSSRNWRDHAQVGSHRCATELEIWNKQYAIKYENISLCPSWLWTVPYSTQARQALFGRLTLQTRWLLEVWSLLQDTPGSWKLLRQKTSMQRWRFWCVSWLTQDMLSLGLHLISAQDAQVDVLLGDRRAEPEGNSSEEQLRYPPEIRIQLKYYQIRA